MKTALGLQHNVRFFLGQKGLYRFPAALTSGIMENMFTLAVKSHFDSAHRLIDYPGDCAHLHGHRWHVEVKLASLTLNEQGMVADFKEIKRALQEVLPDHVYLNEVLPFNPTAENLCRHLYHQLKERFPILTEVTLWETPETSVTYHED